MEALRPVVILTPVKNEAWILPLFLHAACQVADHVLVLDQGSTDGSREVCSRFAKVVVESNPAGSYSEVERTKLLLRHARSKWGSGCVLVGLDADEIPTADSLASPEWGILRRLPAGTCVFFEKPEILDGPRRCLRGAPFPLGYVDDGAELEGGEVIHSRRIPFNSTSPRYFASTLVLMHLARLRMREFVARQAMYCMIENVNRTKALRVRLRYYAPWSFLRIVRDGMDAVPASWYADYEQAGLPMWSYSTERFNSFHLRCLRLMAEHGCKRFWLDDIWWEDWHGAHTAFVRAGVPGLPKQVELPPRLHLAAGKCLSALVRWQVALAASFRRQFAFDSPVVRI